MMMKSLRQAIAIVLLVALWLFADLAAQALKPSNPLDNLLRTAFTARNPKVTQAKVLELRSIGMGAGGYVLLGWGIRSDMRFEGSFDDELFGVFVLDNEMTRIDRTIDIFPTCRWADCIVSIERVSWSASEVVVVGAGSYGDQAFRKTYRIGPTR
jgi:hypothetical protein